MKAPPRSRLLQDEVDVSPSSDPQGPNFDGLIATNSGIAVLELVNAAGNDNNFWIKVVADRVEDAWLAELCKVRSYGAVVGKGDDDDDGRLKPYLAPKETRQFVIEVKVKEGLPSGTRSGVYPMRVEVESRVPLRFDGREEQVWAYPFQIALRPNLLWSLKVDAVKPMRLFGRRRELWATVENAGNDWLYVDLSLSPESAKFEFERLVERIAVPPATKAGASTRRVPFRVRSRHRGLRNTEASASVPLSATRTDAPSVPRFPRNASGLVPSLNLSDAVVLQPTPSETQQASGPEVVYRYPIPATWADLVNRIKGRIRGFFYFFVFLIGMASISTFACERGFRQFDKAAHIVGAVGKADVKNAVDPGKTLTITGKNLDRSEVVVTVNNRLLQGAKIRTRANDLLIDIPRDAQQQAGLPPTEKITDAKVTVTRKPFGEHSPPLSLFGQQDYTFTINPLNTPKVVIPQKDIVLAAAGQVFRGDDLAIGLAPSSPGFGEKKGKVLLGSYTFQDGEVKWTDRKIWVRIPARKDLRGPDLYLYVHVPGRDKDWKCDHPISLEIQADATTSTPGLPPAPTISTTGLQVNPLNPGPPQGPIGGNSPPAGTTPAITGKPPATP